MSGRRVRLRGTIKADTMPDNGIPKRAYVAATQTSISP